MKCPIDNTDLLIADRQGIEIDYCPKCRGVWLDRGELDKLIERTAQLETGYAAPAPTRPENRETFYRDDDDYEHKRKNDDRYQAGSSPYAQPGIDDRYREGDRGYQGRKKKSFLGEMFDIFD